jgi:hypothetical protein
MSSPHRLLPDYLWSIYTRFENANEMLPVTRFTSSRGIGNGSDTERILKFRDEMRYIKDHFLHFETYPSFSSLKSLDR